MSTDEMSHDVADFERKFAQAHPDFFAQLQPIRKGGSGPEFTPICPECGQATIINPHTPGCVKDRVNATIRDLVSKQEQWLRDTARQMGLTPEQLAERYVLEVHPDGPVQVIGDTFKLTQTVRIKRRDPASSGPLGDKPVGGMSIPAPDGHSATREGLGDKP